MRNQLNELLATEPNKSNTESTVSTLSPFYLFLALPVSSNELCGKDYVDDRVYCTDANFSDGTYNVKLVTGDRKAVFWLPDNKDYIDIVKSVETDEKMNILFDKSDWETLNFAG